MMNDDAPLQTLMQSPFVEGLVRADTPDVLFVNARSHASLSSFQTLSIQQYFKPYHDALQAMGAQTIETLEALPSDHFSAALILMPKNMIEAKYTIARALDSLRDDSPLVVAAANKEGGARLEKIAAEITDQSVEVFVKNKCRCIMFKKANIGQNVLIGWQKAGEAQSCAAHQYLTQPGIYGWDKIDKGSALLAAHLPEKLKGNVADFGCGYGYLSAEIKSRMTGGVLYAIDADARAVKATLHNVPEVQAIWADITNDKAPVPKALDAIIMNPPFHEGKQADYSIGQKFIERAAQCLKRKGVLYMVANNHLPYERILDQHFFTSETVAQAQGFKIFQAFK